MPDTEPWWITIDSPGQIGDPEIWIDESRLNAYAARENPSGLWIGATIRFEERPGLECPAVYQISSRRHSLHNHGQPYYVARWPD